MTLKILVFKFHHSEVVDILYFIFHGELNRAFFLILELVLVPVLRTSIHSDGRLAGPLSCE